MTEFAVACIQFEAASADNIAQMSSLVAKAKARFPWVDMVVFGELSVFGPRPSTAQPLPGPAESHFCGLARKHKIWLLPGSLYEQCDGAIYNTAPVINPDGEVVARHRKIYPFLPYEVGVAGGDQCTVFDVPGVGRFGLSICYDMWFPETTRTMTWMGAEVIIHPTMTNTIDRNLELAISRASAATNQCYFMDINSVGEIGYGQSIVVGPEGEVIHQSGTGAEIIPVRLDLSRVKKCRENGVLGLGQPLKSFRDRPIAYPPYANGQQSDAYEKLGALKMP